MKIIFLSMLSFADVIISSIIEKIKIIETKFAFKHVIHCTTSGPGKLAENLRGRNMFKKKQPPMAIRAII